MKTKFLALFLAAAAITACDDQLDTNPTASIDDATALSTPRGLEVAMTGSYTSLTSGNIWGRVMPTFSDLYSDNLSFTGTFTTDQEVALRSITPPNGATTSLWLTAYFGINQVNNILAAIPNVTELTAAQANSLRGEALFVRSLHYHTLVRAFGGVPLITEPTRSPDENAPARSTQAEVYTRIETDLEEAATLLTGSDGDGRADRMAAIALLARVYLDDGKFALARDRATTVIASGGYSLVNYADIFETKHSDESIFELTYTTQSANNHAFFFFPQALGGRRGYAPTTSLANAYELGDPRRAATIDSLGTSGTRFGVKYFRIGVGDDNVVILRLAEMYLIRAEANMRLGAPIATVLADINVVRARAGRAPLSDAVITTQAQLITALAAEQRVEFALEGHRFYDLRRLGLATTVLSLAPERLLWPIPQRELDTNELLTQNPGY
jgi:starch-binding outer membrane protein, SusD/RagB family